MDTAVYTSNMCHSLIRRLHVLSTFISHIKPVTFFFQFQRLLYCDPSGLGGGLNECVMLSILFSLGVTRTNPTVATTTRAVCILVDSVAS